MAKISKITCAFCQGQGKDPFELLSSKATCQVCGGRGKVVVMVPYRKCAHCQGSGVNPHSRVVCTSCNGKGVIWIHSGSGRKTCPQCQGTGKAPESDLPCLTCQGKGVI